MVEALSRQTNPLRPVVASPILHQIWFTAAGIMTLGMLAYLCWAHIRGLITWAELWAFEAQLTFGGLLFFCIGLAFRWRWSKKKRALQAYENMLTRIACSESN